MRLRQAATRNAVRKCSTLWTLSAAAPRALATAIALNAGAAYTYSLRAMEAVEAQRG